MIYDLDGMLPARAFQRDARGHIQPQAGGSGSAPANQNVTTTSIPEYARPYVERSLGQAAAVTDINENPYQPYQGQQVAAFSPMQAQAMGNIANQQSASQLTEGSNLASQAGQYALQTPNQARQLQNVSLNYGQSGAGYGDMASQFGAAGAQQAQQTSDLARMQAAGYGAVGMGYGAQGAQQAAQAQNMATRQANMYGQMGAGYGAGAAGLTGAAQGYGNLGAQYGATGQQYGAAGADIGSIGVNAAQQGFGAGNQYMNMATSPGDVGAFMSPYMQNAVDVQKNEAIRDYQKTMPALNAQAVKSGAFGGSRQALVDAEAQRNLNTQLGNIQATGSQQAYDKAMQSMQFGSNLGVQGLQAGYQGLQTGMQGTAQGLQGAQTGISGAQAGLSGLGQAGQLYSTGMQGAGVGLQGVGQQLSAGQLGLSGTAQGMQGAQTGLSGVGQQLASGQLGLSGAQAGMQGAQAGMQGAQTGLQGVGQATGAGQYGLAGLGVANQSAGTLGQLGQTQFAQDMAINDAQMRAGALQQAQEQKGLDIQQQQYMESLNYPYKQLGFMSDMYRGLPLSQSSQAMYQNPSAISQAAGLGTAAYGMYQMGKKNGGAIREGDGLDTLGLYNAMRKQG